MMYPGLTFYHLKPGLKRIELVNGQVIGFAAQTASGGPGKSWALLICSDSPLGTCLGQHQQYYRCFTQLKAAAETFLLDNANPNANPKEPYMTTSTTETEWRRILSSSTPVEGAPPLAKRKVWKGIGDAVEGVVVGYEPDPVYFGGYIPGSSGHSGPPEPCGYILIRTQDHTVYVVALNDQDLAHKVHAAHEPLGKTMRIELDKPRSAFQPFAVFVEII